MWQIIALFLILLLAPVLKWIVAALIGFPVLYLVIRSIYHKFNPEAKRGYLEWKAKEAEADIKRNEADRKRKEQEEAGARARKEREEAERRRNEFERQQHRDGDQQIAPYTYKIGTHGNESLAIRYGIANQELKVKEYYYYAKDGEQKRNPERDKFYYDSAGTIRLQKTKKVKKDLYEVLLSDFRDRKARAIIEVGTEYVKTFYPLDDSWFEKHADLEETLKGNNSFTLKELATFHVQKTVGT